MSILFLLTPITHHVLDLMSSWRVLVSSHTKLHFLCGSSSMHAMSSPAALSKHVEAQQHNMTERKPSRILSISQVIQIHNYTTWDISRAFITAEKEKRLCTFSFRAWANRITLCKTVALWFTVPVQPSMSTATPRVIKWCLEKTEEIK